MTIEELNVLITANTDNLRKEINELKKQLTGIQNTASKSSRSLFATITKSNIATKLITKSMQILKSNIDDAVSRLDALNNFPRVMSNLGISNEDANASMKRLSDALIGLPTKLEDATQSVQRFASANGNVKASTEMFLALNNAILAGGGSAQVQATALEQLSQSYAKGKPDMMEWRSAMTAMPAQLKQVAIAMGYADASQLGEALRGGKVSMDEFMKKLIELNKNGANGFKSFEEQARNSTGGVSTSITNVKTALTRGLAEIMNAIGQSNIAGFFQGIARAINSVVPYITGFVKACMWAISSINALFGKSTKNQVDSTSKSVNTLGTSANSTAGDINSATKSAQGLNKQLSKLAGFDEMNVLQENTSSGGDESTGGSATGGIGDIDLSGFETMSDELSKADKIAEKLKDVFGGIGNIMRSIWDSEPIQSFVGFATTYGQFLFDYWSTLGLNLWTNLQTTWTSIETDVGTTLTNMSLLWTGFWTDLDLGIQTWGQPIITGVSGVFNSIWKDAIDPTIKTISKVWADFSGILVTTWNTYGKPLIDNIGEFATKTIALFQKIWDDVLEPIITPFLETLSWLWDKHIKGMVENVANFIMKLVNGALEIYNKFIQPVAMWLIDKLAPVWAFIGNFIVGTLGTVIGVITDVISGIIKVFGGLIDFITGIFTGNWEKAWNGVKDIFGGVFDALKGLFKAPINWIIDGINSFIAGLNKIQVPDWVPAVGGKGINIPKIPKLARGGIIDKPTTALIGEQGREAVIPLENNTDWIDNLADKLGATGNGQPIQLTVKIGEDTILDKFIEGINQKAFENNGEVFNV